MLACNKLENVRRRAERARGPDVTCAASRHLMMLADDMSKRNLLPMPFVEERQEVAATMYSVLESLWKARKKLKSRMSVTAPKRP